MYSPKIKEALIPRLYRLKQKTKKPMTQIVNEAVTEYLQKIEEIHNYEYQYNTHYNQGCKQVAEGH